MIGGLLRRLIDAVSQDRVETISDEIADLREEVLSNRTQMRAARSDLEERVSSIESWKEERDDHIDTNAQAVEHIIEAVHHTVDSGEDPSEAALPDEAIAYMAELEERVAQLENRLDVEKTSLESSGRPTNRTIGRPDDVDGRPGSLAGTAEDAKTGERLWQKATPAQQSVLQTMYDAGYPMSYKEIADEVGRSVSTVKNHINNLKAAGYDFKEDAGHNNAKKYMLDDRIKAFLTLRLNE
jgi:DNA-binding CsgD family transcriptional regulator